MTTGEGDGKTRLPYVRGFASKTGKEVVDAVAAIVREVEGALGVKGVITRFHIDSGKEFDNEAARKMLEDLKKRAQCRKGGRAGHWEGDAACSMRRQRQRKTTNATLQHKTSIRISTREVGCASHIRVIRGRVNARGWRIPTARRTPKRTTNQE